MVSFTKRRLNDRFVRVSPESISSYFQLIICERVLLIRACNFLSYSFLSKNPAFPTSHPLISNFLTYLFFTGLLPLFVPQYKTFIDVHLTNFSHLIQRSFIRSPLYLFFELYYVAHYTFLSYKYLDFSFSLMTYLVFPSIRKMKLPLKLSCNAAPIAHVELVLVNN